MAVNLSEKSGTMGREALRVHLGRQLGLYGQLLALLGGLATKYTFTLHSASQIVKGPRSQSP